MPPRPQRLVRRQPLSQSLRAMLNPMDFYLWLSEEIQTLNWDSKTFGTRFGLVANLIFMVARANAGKTREAVDDVFGDAPANGWFTLLANFLQWALISISALNAFYTMTRSRHYRLFEMNVEAAGPGTPSAQRVRVDSPPASSTPLRLIQEVLRPETADQRAHPDKTRDVWEMKVWDPYPATLRMFCLFSPGHVFIHMLFLPLPNLDPRPSVTVFKCFLLQVILSAQLLLMHSRFSQQSKDTAIIQKEVMHEYDVKYVHPRLQPVVREVSTQVSITDGNVDEEEITVGTPATVIRRSFQTHPNPNYARYVDPDVGQSTPTRTMSPQLRPAMPLNPFTPSSKPRASMAPSFAAQVQQQRQSALRNSLPPTASTTGVGGQPATPFATSKTSASTGTSTGADFNVPATSGYGGSLGVYSHVNSPLKKATSLGDMNGVYQSPRNNREMAALEQRDLAERMIRQSSPSKEHRRATGAGLGAQLDQSQGQGRGSASFMHSPEKLARARASRWTQERFPTRRV
ncbi:hypothetical protein C7999DRAFT_35085 [Corynascus novoguineensis]|uniref:Nuclear rim protein 1 n=1 Tax=Corynascus novoguineensis TaxID=1126955 RepID=A0AAN7CNM6_9PEZI|nr:hypothetical protein C7999DRAFT_35085 [Corynascus novoguineensis]